MEPLHSHYLDKPLTGELAVARRRMDQAKSTLLRIENTDNSSASPGRLAEAYKTYLAAAARVEALEYEADG